MNTQNDLTRPEPPVLVGAVKVAQYTIQVTANARQVTGTVAGGFLTLDIPTLSPQQADELAQLLSRAADQARELDFGGAQ